MAVERRGGHDGGALAMRTVERFFVVDDLADPSLSRDSWGLGGVRLATADVG